MINIHEKHRNYLSYTQYYPRWALGSIFIIITDCLVEHSTSNCSKCTSGSNHFFSHLENDKYSWETSKLSFLYSILSTVSFRQYIHHYYRPPRRAFTPNCSKCTSKSNHFFSHLENDKYSRETSKLSFLYSILSTVSFRQYIHHYYRPPRRAFDSKLLKMHFQVESFFFTSREW